MFLSLQNKKYSRNFPQLLSRALLFLTSLFIPAEDLLSKFFDATENAGIDEFERFERPIDDFVVRGGTPIVMDFDQNGWLDIYIVRHQLEDLIYLNHEGTFTKQVNPLGLDTKNGGNVAAWADIDSDGDKDMIVGVADSRNHLLYLNNGDGTFTENAVERGLSLPARSKDHQATAVTVGDVNRDGYLDVIVGSWGIALEEEYQFDHYALFINQGAEQPGYFDNVTQDAGYLFTDPDIDIFSPAITDLDQDGWPDIATSADFGNGSLHWNNADGTFSNNTVASGTGEAFHAMGTAIGDVNNDGEFDWFVTTIARSGEDNSEVNPLYINQGNRLFENRSVAAGVSHGGWGWGTNMFDYDLDGDLDIVMVNQDNNTADGGIDEGRMFLFRNNGNAEFTDVSAFERANKLSRGAGIVTFDYDNDGALDIFYINQFSRPTLLENERTADNDSLRIALAGTVSNPSGIGALVTVQPDEDGPSYIREFNPTNAYLAQLSPYLHFGFPEDQDQSIYKITVRWPSSIEQEVLDVSPDQLLTIVEDETLLAGDTTPVFETQPPNLVATRGDPLNLAVSFEDGFRPTVTWYRNGVLLAGYEGLSITIDAIQPPNAGTYHAIATNSAGSAQSEEFIVAVRSDLSDRNIVRQWNELMLDSARINFPDPPIVARTFYHCSAAIWDAFWTYHPNGWNDAQPLFHHEDISLNSAFGTREAQQAEAISHAVFTVATKRYRKAFNHDAILYALSDFMRMQGYDPGNLSTEGNSPAAVGNRIGNAILDISLDDGSNEANGYADTTDYAPVNEPLIYGESGVTLVDPNRWQPLNLSESITKNGIDLGPEVQQFLAPGWNWVTPFALEKPTPDTILIDPGPQPLFGTETEAQLISEMVEVIRASSIMDPDQNVIIDASPGAAGQNNPWLTQEGQGHPLNPYTGQPYAPNPVNRGDYFRLTAEFWSDGPGIEGPPGVWNMLHNQVTDDPRFTRKLGGVGPELSQIEWDVHAYLALNGALHDAAIAAWTIKSKYDSIRPISMIRYLASLGQSSDPDLPNYHPSGLPLEPGLIELITADSSAEGQRHTHLRDYVGELALYSWRGVPENPRQDVSGVGWIRAADWSPYHLRTFPTPNFAGYVSGHSTFSRAGAEVMALLTGSPYFPGGIKEFDFEAGKYLQVEYGPSEDLTIQVATYYDAADITGVARIYCGVHIAADDFVGRKVGARVGADAVLRVLSLRQNKSTASQSQISSPCIRSSHTPEENTTLISYGAENPFSVHRANSLEIAQASEETAIFTIPADNDEYLFYFHGQYVSHLSAKGQSNATTPLSIDFSIRTDEPQLILASSSAPDIPALKLYEKIGDNLQLISSNLNWQQHPSASLAATFTERSKISDDTIPENANALLLALAEGDYRLVAETSSDQPQPTTLTLETVKDR